MGKKLLIEDFKEWDRLVENSYQGNIFQSSLFLKSLNIPFKCYFVKSDNLIYSGIIVLEKDNEMYKFPPYCQYQGIIFSELVNNKKNHSRKNCILLPFKALKKALRANYE